MGYQVGFGDIVLIRSFCLSCSENSLVIDNKYQCCNSKYTEETVGFKLEIEAKGYRKQPTKKVQLEILENQSKKCFYCSELFGYWLWRKGKLIQLRVTWDHLIPFSYLLSNPKYNFVAVCQICNSIKSNKIFDSVEELKEYINEKRESENGSRKLRKLQPTFSKEKISSKILQHKLQDKSLERQKSKNAVRLTNRKLNCIKCGISFIQYNKEFKCKKCILEIKYPDTATLEFKSFCREIILRIKLYTEEEYISWAYFS